MLNSSLLEEFEGKPIEKISSVEIERYRARLIGDGLSPSTVNKKVVALNGIFKLAKRRHGLALNPCETVERQPIKASGQYTAYEPAQVVKLAASAPEPYGTLFLVAGFSGLRLGELRALRWEHIDFTQRTIAVEKNYVGGVEYLPKSSKVRSVPLISEASKALLALKAETELDQPEDLLFPSPTGGWLDDSKTRKVFAKAIVKAKVPAYRFHDLRHTFATLMIRALPIHDVQRIMGHEDIQTTMRYLHSKPMPQQTDALDGLVAAALKPDLKLVDDEGEKAA
jgi:integrase